MNAHELDQDGKIINTIVVRDLDFPGKRLVDAALGGTVGDSVINGVLVPHIPAPAPRVVPQTVPRKAAKLALLNAGHLAAVVAYVEALPEPERTAALIDLNDSETYSRGHPFVGAMQAVLALTDDEVDDLFVEADAIARNPQ